MSGHYNKNGEPISVEEWAKLLGQGEYKVIEQTVLPNGKWVSTVWLGLDHNFGKGSPLIFETMVFPEKGNRSELAQERYSTETEAKEGHQKMVEEWSEK